MKRVPTFVPTLFAITLAIAGCNGYDQGPSGSAVSTPDAADVQAEQVEGSEPEESAPEVKALSPTDLEFALLTQEDLGTGWEWNASSSEGDSEDSSAMRGLSEVGSLMGSTDDTSTEPSDCLDYYKKWVNPFEGEVRQEPTAEAGVAFLNEAEKSGLFESIEFYDSGLPDTISFYQNHVQNCPEINASDATGTATATMEVSELPVQELGDESYGIRYDYRTFLEGESFIQMSVDVVIISRGLYQLTLGTLGAADNPFDADELKEYSDKAISRLDAVLSGELKTPEGSDADNGDGGDSLTHMGQIFNAYVNGEGANLCQNILSDSGVYGSEFDKFLEYYLRNNDLGETEITNPHTYEAAQLIQQHCELRD